MNFYSLLRRAMFAVPPERIHHAAFAALRAATATPLQRRGLSDAQIANIWSGNVLRVMRQAQDYAAKNAAKPIAIRSPSRSCPSYIPCAATCASSTSTSRTRCRPAASLRSCS